jgi:hypothetical protein
MSSKSNPWDISQLKHMKIEDEVDTSNISSFPSIIQPSEAERYIEKLQKFQIEQVGSSDWLNQHQMLEKLNLQAHQSAKSNSDEFILELLLTYNKIPIIIYNLLIIEIWKEYIYPILFNNLSNNNLIRVYFILYHEATLINLLEIILYHKHICETNNDQMLELVDYCARKLTRLNSVYDFRSQDPNISNHISNLTHTKNINNIIERQTEAQIKAQAMLQSFESSTSSQDELTRYFTQIEFQVCISAVTISRYIVEHAQILPLNVLSRVTDTTS